MTFRSHFCRKTKISGTVQGPSRGIPEFFQRFWEVVSKLKSHFCRCPRNTDFSPTGPSPGTFGGLPGSLDLPSRAAWVVFTSSTWCEALFLHFALLQKSGVGEIRRPGPMYKKASEGPIFRHIFADIYGSSPPPPHVDTQEIQIGSKLSSEQRRVSGKIRNRLFQ